MICSWVNLIMAAQFHWPKELRISPSWLFGNTSDGITHSKRDKFHYDMGEVYISIDESIHGHEKIQHPL
jgi:hypothetical protein